MSDFADIVNGDKVLDGSKFSFVCDFNINKMHCIVNYEGE